MSGRTADALTETIELLLGVAVVLVMFLVVPWAWVEPVWGDAAPELAGVPAAVLVTYLPRLLAVVALIWMIRFYLRPDDEV